MRKLKFALLALAMMSANNTHAAGTATPEEIYEGVLKGVEVLQRLGEEGLPAFNDPKGDFAWKDTYVQVYNCEAQQIPGHINPTLRDWTPEEFAGIMDKKGNPITKIICDAAKQPNGGWIEYWWPKAGETEASRKITFTIQVPGQPYQVSAGIYDDQMSITELNTMSN